MIYPLYNCLKIASDLDIKWVIRFIKRNLEDDREYFKDNKTKFEECKEEHILASFSDLLIWIIISFVVFISSSMSNFSHEFIINLRTVYLLPYSFLVLATAITIPYSIKYFREMKYSFFFLSLGFLLDFINLSSFDDSNIISQIVYSIKFVSFSSIVFNFYKMTVFPPQDFSNNPDKKNECD